MLNETIVDIIEVAPSRPFEENGTWAWPSHYVVTSKATYEYNSDYFHRTSHPLESTSVFPPEVKKGKIIKVLGDSESTTLILDNGGMIDFFLEHDIFGPDPIFLSWPSVEMLTAEDYKAWKEEIDDIGEFIQLENGNLVLQKDK